MAKSHIHQYQRVKVGKHIYWKCVDGCPHSMFGNLVIGNRSRCSCGHTFIMDKEKTRRRVPKCDSCQAHLSHRQAEARAVDNEVAEAVTVLKDFNIDDMLLNLNVDDKWKKGRR